MATSVDLTKNKMWFERMSQYFDYADVNKSGYLTIDEMLQWVGNAKTLCKATDEEMTNLTNQTKIFWGEVGLKPGVQMSKQEFINGINRLAQNELERKRNGEQTLHEQYSNAFFDVLDINNNGTVTLDEVKTLMKACNMDPNGAEPWLNAADINKDGKVQRKELIKVEFNVWFRPDMEQHSNLFDAAFPGLEVSGQK